MKRLFLIVFFHALFISYCQAQHYVLYGLTAFGGSNSMGTLFKYDPVTLKETVVYNFDGSHGSYPDNSLIQASNGLLYGLAEGGGKYNTGVVFSYDISTGKETDLVDFDTLNGSPYHGAENLFQAKDNNLYGMTWSGGKYNDGVIFRYDIIAKKDSVVYNFDSIHGKYAGEGFVQDTLSGLLFGFTQEGGNYNKGVMFSFDPIAFIEKVVIDFNDSDGAFPLTTLYQAPGRLLYGMTEGGGDSDQGVLFRYNIATGNDTVLVKFDDTNGQHPLGNYLIKASDGLLYGITYEGGTKYPAGGLGTLFSYNPNTDIEKVLVKLNTNVGGFPLGALVQDPDDGRLYGLAPQDGGVNDGLIFRYDITTGQDTVLLHFNGTNGETPYGSLLLVKDTLTGINEIAAKNESISVYPNPSKGVFNFSITNYNQETRNNIEVYNVLGEKVSQVAVSNSQFTINLVNEPSGIYLFRIISENGSLVASGKLIVE